MYNNKYSNFKYKVKGIHIDKIIISYIYLNLLLCNYMLVITLNDDY